MSALAALSSSVSLGSFGSSVSAGLANVPGLSSLAGVNRQADSCTGECLKSGPWGFAIILLLAIACYFLFRSMSKRLKRVREQRSGLNQGLNAGLNDGSHESLNNGLDGIAPVAPTAKPGGAGTPGLPGGETPGRDAGGDQRGWPADQIP